MTRLSIEASFTWAQRFVAREWGLVLPVALAFLAFPPLVFDLAAPDTFRQVLMTAPVKNVAAVKAALVWLVPVMLGLLVSYGIGALTITALALKPRISVAEAVLLALRRLPVLAASAAMLSTALVLFTFAEALLFGMIGMGAARLQAVVLSMLIVAAIVLLVRMTPLVGVIVERRIGPIDAISETWMLGHGAGWKMALGLFLYNVGGMLVLVALGTAIGASLLAAGQFGGWTDLAQSLSAVFNRVLAGIVMAGSYLLGASFYRQLVGPDRNA